MRPSPIATISGPLRPDVERVAQLIETTGVRSALQFLNRRTPHRFTGIFRFDGDMLRSVELIDKWDPAVERGDDIPIEQAYCAHLRRTGEPLHVTDGRVDPRVPWMSDSPVVCYCGVVVEDESGRPWGALCHFDVRHCESAESDMPLMLLPLSWSATRFAARSADLRPRCPLRHGTACGRSAAGAPATTGRTRQTA